MRKKIILVAGGTGGHLNAALAIGSEFEKNNFETIYISGQRYLDYQILNNQKNTVYNLNSMALRFKNPLKIVKSFWINSCLLGRAFLILKKENPLYVVGTGGYICGPIILAARILRIKTGIVEQNAVMGITNRILKLFSNKIFINFSNTKYLKSAQNIILSGNPIRSEIKWETQKVTKNLKILVFGGSLGAKQINDIICELIEDGGLSEIEITHQVGKGNVNNSLKMTSKIKYHQVEYINNMQEAYTNSDLIICRSGASTISELEIVQRPVVLIPYAQASDNHQMFNAIEFQKKQITYTKIIDPTQDQKIMKMQLLKVIDELKDDRKLQEKSLTKYLNARKVIYDEMVRL